MLALSPALALAKSDAYQAGYSLGYQAGKFAAPFFPYAIAAAVAVWLGWRWMKRRDRGDRQARSG